MAFRVCMVAKALIVRTVEQLSPKSELVLVVLTFVRTVSHFLRSKIGFHGDRSNIGGNELRGIRQVGEANDLIG